MPLLRTRSCLLVHRRRHRDCRGHRLAGLALVGADLADPGDCLRHLRPDSGLATPLTARSSRTAPEGAETGSFSLGIRGKPNDARDTPSIAVGTHANVVDFPRQPLHGDDLDG